jgi:hypothetical protein
VGNGMRLFLCPDLRESPRTRRSLFLTAAVQRLRLSEAANSVRCCPVKCGVWRQSLCFVIFNAFPPLPRVGNHKTPARPFPANPYSEKLSQDRVMNPPELFVGNTSGDPTRNGALLRSLGCTLLRLLLSGAPRSSGALVRRRQRAAFGGPRRPLAVSLAACQQHAKY